MLRPFPLLDSRKDTPSKLQVQPQRVLMLSGMDFGGDRQLTIPVSILSELTLLPTNDPDEQPQHSCAYFQLQWLNISKDTISLLSHHLLDPLHHKHKAPLTFDGTKMEHTRKTQPPKKSCCSASSNSGKKCELKWKKLVKANNTSPCWRRATGS